MRAEVVIASIIAVSGALAIGQAVDRGLADEPAAKPQDAQSTRCTPVEPGRPGDRDLTVGIVGDAVTEWRPPEDAATSWVTYARGDGVRVLAASVDADARARDLSAGLDPIDADVLVVLTGTNDLPYAYSDDSLELSLQRIVDAAGVDEVLISSIPPVPRLAGETADYNEFLAEVAYRHDWSFVDAGSAVVARDCGYRLGLESADGVRPSPAGAELIGTAVRAALTGRARFAPGG